MSGMAFQLGFGEHCLSQVENIFFFIRLQLFLKSTEKQNFNAEYPYPRKVYIALGVIIQFAIPITVGICENFIFVISVWGPYYNRGNNSKLHLIFAELMS